MKMKYIYLLLVSIFLSLTSCNLNQPKEELYTEIVGIEKEAMMDLVVSNYDSGQHGKSRSFSSIYHHWKNNKQNVYALTRNTEYDLICGYLPKNSPVFNKLKYHYDNISSSYSFYTMLAYQHQISVNDLRLFSFKTDTIPQELDSCLLLFINYRFSYQYKGETKYILYSVTYKTQENNFQFELNKWVKNTNAKLLFLEEDLKYIKTYCSDFEPPYSCVIPFNNQINSYCCTAVFYADLIDDNDAFELLSKYKVDDESLTTDRYFAVDYEGVKKLLNIIELD